MSEKLAQKPSSPLSILSSSLHLYKHKFFIIVGILLIKILLVAAIIFTGIAIAFLFKLSLSPSGGSIIILLATVIASSIAYYWGDLALFYAVGYEVKVIEAYSDTWRLINSYLWICCLNLLFITAGIILSLALCIFLATLPIPIQYYKIPPSLIAGFTITGCVMIPIFIWTSFAIPSLIDDEEKGIGALLKSKGYTRGRVLYVAASYLIFIVIFVAITFVASFLVVISGPTSALLKKALSLLFIPFFFDPLLTIYRLFLYRALKYEKGETSTPTKKQKIIFSVAALAIVIILPIVILLLYRNQILGILFLLKPHI